jgi:hypothetical protein
MSKSAESVNGVLGQVEEMLGDVLAAERPGAAVSLWGRARLRLLDAQPGVPTRPAGNGDPGTGRSSFTHAGRSASSSVVELAAERSVEFGDGWERGELVKFYALPWRLGDQLMSVCEAHGWSPVPPADGGLQRVAWSRWVVRKLIAGEVSGLTMGEVRPVQDAASDLRGMVQRWSGRAQVKVSESRRLADDASGMWCRSHLRIGAKEPRSDKYPKLGLCRWCGDFQAGEGFLPTPVLLEMHRDGRRVTSATIEAERPKKGRKRR